MTILNNRLAWYVTLAIVLLSGTTVTGVAQEAEPAEPEITTTDDDTTPGPPEPTFDEPPDLEPDEPTPGDELVNDRPPFFTGVAVNRADGVYPEGSLLRVRFKAERDAHLYLLYHMADGQCVLLYPNVAQRDNRVQAKTEITVPEDETKFRFRIGAPFGKESLQVLAAERPLAELDSLVRASRAAPIPPATIAALQKRIAAEPQLLAEHRVAIRTLAGGEQLPAAPQAARAGLFIGIADYAGEGWNEMQPMRNGATYARDLLLKRGRLDPNKTRLLVDRHATRANIQQAITQWLPSVTRPGDTVFIWYNGHGMSIKNTDGTERDGRDEGLSCHDTRLDDDATMRKTSIMDDTLARWLAELDQRQIVLVLDTCHAGGIAAGKSIERPQRTPTQDQVRGAQAVSEALADEVRRMDGVGNLNTVILAACGPNQYSYGSLDPKGLPKMTLFLAEAMESGKPPVTVADAYQHLKRRSLQMADKLKLLQTPIYTDRALLPIVFTW